MRKLGLLVCLIFLLISGSLFSKSDTMGMTSVGIYGNLLGSGTGTLGSGIGATVKFGNFPVIGAEWMFGNSSRIAVSCDYWVINNKLSGPLWYYLGLGAYAGFGLGGQSASIDCGGRIPIGIQIMPLKKFEIFAEVAPLVAVLPTISIGYSIRAGFRIHF